MVFKGSCSRIEDLLWPYADNKLADSDRLIVEEHLAKCGRCRQRVAETRATVELMTGLKENPAPGSALGWGDLSRRLEHAAASAAAPQRRSLVPAGMALAAAFSVALVVSFGHRTGLSSMGAGSQKTVSEAQPAATVPPVTGLSAGGAQLVKATPPARLPQAAESLSGTGEASALLVGDSGSRSRFRPVESLPIRTHFHSIERSAPPAVGESRNAVNSTRDSLGVGAEEPAPDRNLVLTGVKPSVDSQNPTNYVMGSIPAPQTVSAQDGQGRSETL